MIIVRIQGGLGNQMFQYVLFRFLQNQGTEAGLDVSLYSEKSIISKANAVHQGYELEALFSVKSCYADEKLIKKLGNVKMGILHRAWRKIFGFKSTHIRSFELENNKLYFPELCLKDNVYLDGTWCTFSYANEIQQEIRNEFSFIKPMSLKNQQLLEKIKGENAVSIHVRHGDYLNLKNRYAILTKKYYSEAMNYISKHVENPVYYCFSDDIKWCKENLKADKIIYVDWNTGENSYQDMQLMSLCSHNIIANSTFSMWGAWLNANPQKLVIRPRHYFSDEKEEYIDMWPESWISIDN